MIINNWRLVKMLNLCKYQNLKDMVRDTHKLDGFQEQRVNYVSIQDLKRKV